MSLQYLLRLQEKKGILTNAESTNMLDGVLDQLKELGSAISPSASPDAAR